jgi:predicted XRE-type DNA-binding protein
MKRKNSGAEIAKMLGISHSRGMEATIKAQLISAVLETARKEEFTHAEIAKKAKLPRSAVTGILSGSLQKVTIDRVLKLIEAVGLMAEVRIKKIAA